MEKSEKLVQNNLEAQLSLLNDIASNYRCIIYHITERGKDALKIIRERKYSEDGQTVIYSKENFDLLFDIASILSDSQKFDQLGILAKNAVPDNECKLNILNILQK